MAFSTFRGFLAASATVAPPPSPTNYYIDASKIVYDTVYPVMGYQRNSLIPGSSTVAYALFNDTNNYLYANVITTQTGGPSVTIGTSIQLTTVTPQSFPVGDAIDSTHFGAMWLNASGEMTAAYITNSSGTLTATNTYTSSTNTGGPNFARSTAYMTLSSTTALLCASGVSAKPVEMINPTLSSGQLITSGTGTWTTGQPIYGIALSSTLAAVAWINSSNQIEISTIDVSGSSITVNTAVNSSRTILSNSGIGICKVNSTTMLMVYPISTSSIGFRTVTLASGGSVTYNTEVTQSAAFARQPIFQPTSFGTNQFITAWTTNDTSSSNQYGGLYLLDLVISGTSITLGTINQAIQNPLALASYNAYSALGSIVNMSSSRVLMSYLANTQSTGTNVYSNGNTIMRILPIDIGNPPSTWGATWSGNGTYTAVTVSNNVNNNGMAIIGGDNAFIAENNSIDILDLDYSTVYNNSNTSWLTGGTNYNSLTSVIPVDSSTTAAQFVAIGYDGTNLRAYTGEIGGLLSGSGSTTFVAGASSSVIDNSVTLNSTYFVCASYTASQTIAIYSRTTGIYAAIITSGNNSISSITTPVQVYSATLTNTIITMSVISSTNILVTFQPNQSGTAYALILSISGTTITAGTAVALPTNPATSSAIGCCALTSSNGLITYKDNSTGNMMGVPFAFSGTTITMGSNTAFTTSGSITTSVSTTGNLVAVSSTEAMCMFYDNGSGAGLRATLLTSTSGTTFSAGTNYNITSAFSAGNAAIINLVKATPSKLVGYTTTSGGNSLIRLIQLYRS